MDRVSNPHNWKGGGYLKISNFAYTITPGYKWRKKPAADWGACYLKSEDGQGDTHDEYTVWGYGWSDAYDATKDSDGPEKIRNMLSKCGLISFKWALTMEQPDKPWEWRANFTTRSDRGVDCVQDGLQQLSGLKNLVCNGESNMES
ncbi:hypothetical protein TWF696_006840 [Orbilia brochopaga]|uniref:Uncharacterized protein n=1 Tax=Orbilia brochopaga TaxID=3140254 RepID=A0AAV9UUC8_9PEZI